MTLAFWGFTALIFILLLLDAASQWRYWSSRNGARMDARSIRKENTRGNNNGNDTD